MSDNDKQALLDGSATIQTKIEVLSSNGESTVLTEENAVVSWDYEDFRYVKDEGWIGQFVARQVNGVVKNISDDFSITDKEFILYMGVKVGDTTTWYSLGNFLVNKVTDDEVNDKTTFEALDYTKRFNQTYVDSITYPCTALELAQNVCEQCGCELGNTDFKHNDWEITGNVFTNGESCREVLKAIGKLAYSWVRVDWDNKVYIDFSKQTEVSEYNKIDNSKYYSLTTQKEKFGAVNRVVIGYKDIEGERTKIEDTESIEANGVNEITVFDNPLVYNQELREKAIVGAEDLFGLEYMPLEMLTVGHPWLKGDELVEVTDMEGNIHNTIPFDRTIQYFGHIKTKINVATNTKTNTEYAYESGVGGRLRKTEMMVDKINGQITQIIDEQDETSNKLNEIVSTVDETKQTISKVETTVTDITTTTQTSTGGNSLYLEDALESNALEYHIDGKSEQDTSTQQDGDNIFDLNTWVDKVSVSQGSVSCDGKTLTMSNPTAADQYTRLFHMSSTPSDENKVMVQKTGKEIISLTQYTLSYDNPNGCSNQCYIIWYDENFAYLSLSSTAKNSDSRIFLTATSPSNAKYCSLRFDNEGYGTDITELVITNVAFKKGTDSTYSEFVPNSQSPDYPSEIKTIKGIENLFNNQDYTRLGNIDDTGNDVASTNTYRFNTYHECKANTNIYLSKELCIYYYDENKNFISYDVNGGLTKTTPANTSYVRFRTFAKDFDTFNADDYMVSYEPIKTYVPYGSWAKVKITGKNILNPDELISGGYSVSTGEYFSSEASFCTKYNIKIDNTKPYYLSHNVNNAGQYYYVMYYDENKNFLGQYSLSIATKTMKLSDFEKYSQTKYINIRFDASVSQINNIQLEENKLTEYEEYKENEVLIDLSKPNLWDLDNWSIYTGSLTEYGSNGFTLLKSSNRTVGLMLNEVLPAGQYTLKYDVENSNLSDVSKFGLGVQTRAGTALAFVTDNSNHEITFATTSSIGQLYFFINLDQEDTATISLNNIRLYSGTDDYYELSSIGDTKDTLDIVNGQIVINKKIGKVILDGSETWYSASAINNYYRYTSALFDATADQTVLCYSNYFKGVSRVNLLNANEICAINTGVQILTDDFKTLDEFKTWLSENNTTVYYVLAEPQQIVLPNVNIPLFEDINHITLVDDLETNTSIKYYRNTPIAQDYVVQQQLDKTNSNLAETDNKAEQNASDISSTNINLNNNYYNKGQIDVINSSTTQEIATIKQEVATKITAEDLNIAINKIQTTGATSVTTTTGYTFNENGLNIKKSDSEMSSLLDNDGLVVKRNTTEVLTVRSSGVETENLKVRTYFTVGDNTRVENYKGGTGFFYIGDD